MKEPANLYEAVLALEACKYSKPAEAMPALTLTDEQMKKLLDAIAAVIREGDGK